MKVQVSVVFTNPVDFVNFSHQALPRFCVDLPFKPRAIPVEELLPNIPMINSNLDDWTTDLPFEQIEYKEEGAEEYAQMVTVVEIPQDDMPLFEDVVKSYGGKIMPSEGLDVMDM